MWLQKYETSIWEWERAQLLAQAKGEMKGNVIGVQLLQARAMTRAQRSTSCSVVLYQLGGLEAGEKVLCEISDVHGKPKFVIKGGKRLSASDLKCFEKAKPLGGHD